MRFVMAGTTAPSHIYPSLALIAELVRRGHHISYVVGDRLAELVEPTGADVVAHPSLLPTTEEHWSGDPGEAMQMFLDEQMAALPVIERISPPDAVIYDIGGYGGRIAAFHWGVPAVQLSPTYVAWEGYEEDMADFTAELKASASGARYFAMVSDWLAANEYDIDADSFLGRPEACVVLVPRVLQPNEERVSSRYVFAGPCIDESRRTGWTPPVNDGRPLVYVSLGTSYTDRPDLYERCVNELGDDYRLVIATGKVDPSVLPDTVTAERVMPQLDVLEHADVFLTHAGMGGASEALWHGVPVVAAPQAVDQFQNAATLEAIGAGVQLEERELREAVVAALACAGRAGELREDVRRAGGVVNAADAVETLAGTS